MVCCKTLSFCESEKGKKTRNMDALGYLLWLAFTLISCGVLAEDFPEPRFFISQLMLQSCDNPTNMLTDFNLVVGFWFCENKYFHRRKVLPMKYRSLQDRATGRHRCWWVKLFLSSGFQPKLPKQPKQCFPILFQQASPAWPMFWWDEPTITRGEDFLKAASR